MHYVIIRDDDTNALTPVECLEQLYRPFLDRGFPVNLATIPNVRTDVKIPGGEYEGFLCSSRREEALNIARRPDETLPIATNRELLDYLRANPEYRIVQHGCHHDYFEFDQPCSSRQLAQPMQPVSVGPGIRGESMGCGEEALNIARRLDAGRAQLLEAGLGAPRTFVAPYDKLSRTAMREVAKRFQVLSTGWCELRRLPLPWWPRYLVKRTTHRPHWRVNGTILLTHPGCLLSCHRPYGDMLDNIRNTIIHQRLTVLVTHWWEYFRGGKPDTDFINVLHDTAEFLESDPEVRVISFDDVIDSRVALN